jgi:hypothetical protein
MDWCYSQTGTYCTSSESITLAVVTVCVVAAVLIESFVRIRRERRKDEERNETLFMRILRRTLREG